LAGVEGPEGLSLLHAARPKTVTSAVAAARKRREMFIAVDGMECKERG
jgi:hypothetical protein